MLFVVSVRLGTLQASGVSDESEAFTATAYRGMITDEIGPLLTLGRTQLCT